MTLAYAEEHEQAQWVAHILLRDVAEGRTTRTNDFRTDPKISTGTAVQEDYFLVEEGDGGEKIYDGYGFDRGHLAPSADFRWNQKALSESYFYSNMSPQRPEFNRDSWAELESYIRTYAIENDVDLFVVTGPVLTSDLPKVDRSVNQVSLPAYFYKVALDPVHQRAIGFIMPNGAIEKPMEAYALSIDEVESRTGLDFFAGLEDEVETEVESKLDYMPWLPPEQQGDARILSSRLLGKGRYNTLQAYEFIDSGKIVEVCGTAVSTFKSRNNNIFINLDKKFPNQVFTVTIWERDLQNFSYNPELILKDQKICVRGKVTRNDGVMQMNASNEKQVTIIEDAF
jgi:endonuclease G